MTNITLINVPKKEYINGGNELQHDTSYPIGLLQISSALKQKAHHVDYIDGNFYHLGVEQIMQQIREQSPEFVGLNSTFPNLHLTLSLCKAVKGHDNKIKTVVGGTAATLLTEPIIRNEFVDFVVEREGEETIVDLLKNSDQPHIVKGLAYKKEGKIIKTESRPFLPICKVPLVDVDNIPKEIKEHSNEITLITSRGCDHYCTFCSTPTLWGKGKKYLRQQTTGQILREIDNYRDHGFDFDLVHFLDDNFTGNWMQVEDLMANWKRTTYLQDKQWRCLARANNLNSRDRLALLADSNCYGVSIGVESANNHVLKRIGKKLTIDEVTAFLSKAQEFPIRTKGFFMIGFPNDTKETIQETVDYAATSMFDEIVINMVMAYPGTPMYNQINGTKQPIPAYCDHNIDHVANPHSRKQLLNYSTTPTISLTPGVSLDELKLFKEQAYNRFYGGIPNVIN